MTIMILHPHSDGWVVHRTSTALSLLQSHKAPIWLAAATRGLLNGLSSSIRNVVDGLRSSCAAHCAERPVAH